MSIRIECNITYRCNAICDHCNKAVGLAKFPREDMTVDQMRRAVDQLLEQKVVVKRFTFCGGEPILHKHLQQLIDEVSRLPTLRWGRVLTNGLPHTKPLRDKIVLPYRFTWVENPLDDPGDPTSGKNIASRRGNRRVHSPFWISPADIGKEANWDTCTVRGWCGVGLDSAGWSMCGKAAMFGRLFGIDPTQKEGDIESFVKTPIEDICKHCQYGLTRKEQGEIAKRYRRGELPAVSETFQKAFGQHATQPLIQLEHY